MADDNNTNKEQPNIQAELPIPEPVQTEHSITIDGKVLRYTARTGYMGMKDEEGKHKANIFYTAYTLQTDTPISERPITFAFNGGPGSSSVWLHLGALGPRRVLLSEEGNALPPPYRLVDNEYTWLEYTDLVFIDPVGTGYSRPAKEEKREQFHGVEEDIASVAEFIRLYTTRSGRWLSPKFLAGESYGTTRAAGLSGYLQDRFGMYFNGLLLISTVLQFQTLHFVPGNDLPYILYLPAYTATAWYHGKLEPTLQHNLAATLNEVRAWALGDYMLALAQGDTIADDQRQRTATALARYTGLSEEFILRTDLRIALHRFTKELLRSEHRTAGRLDSRFKGIDRDAAGEQSDYDPSYDTAIYGPFTAAFNDYVRSALHYENDLPYEILSSGVHPWNWGTADKGFTNVAETLREAMTKNPFLKVFVANGYYDLATPFSATEYTINHLGLDVSLQKNITMEYYEAGHMMYIQHRSLHKLYEDTRRFIAASFPQEPNDHKLTDVS